jgi:hypothetical protein
MGEKLRIAWNNQLPAQLKELVAKENGAEATSLLSIAPALRPGDAPGALSAKLRRRQATWAWQWVGNRYKEEAAPFPNGTAENAFFRRAAEEFLQFSP